MSTGVDGEQELGGSRAAFVCPSEEMLAYEVLWARRGATLKSLAAKFQSSTMRPSELLRGEIGLFEDPLVEEVRATLDEKSGFSVALNGCFQYPKGLRDAAHPPELLYYKGDIGLLDTRCVSVVGSRKCSPDGAVRARALSAGLVSDGFTVVSGLAKGIDAAAISEAVARSGNVVGVIGTPIDECYPRENKQLQEFVSIFGLLVSQVPFHRYSVEPFQSKRRYFPQRNETMAAISEATVIVEAGETSGTLSQARACIRQGRTLMIMNSCFENSAITWPRRFEEKGAIRVRNYEDVRRVLSRDSG